MDFLTGEERLRVTRNIAGGGGVVKKIGDLKSYYDNRDATVSCWWISIVLSLKNEVDIVRG